MRLSVHEKISIITPNKAVEPIVRAPINMPMTKTKAAASIDIRPANMLMNMDTNTIGASNMKATISTPL